MYRQIRGCVLNFLLENHFGSKAEMARQLDVSLRTIERLFENLDNTKAGSIVFDKAIWYCAKSRIPLDGILERYMNETEGETKVPRSGLYSFTIALLRNGENANDI